MIYLHGYYALPSLIVSISIKRAHVLVYEWVRKKIYVYTFLLLQSIHWKTTNLYSKGTHTYNHPTIHAFIRIHSSIHPSVRTNIYTHIPIIHTCIYIYAHTSIYPYIYKHNTYVHSYIRTLSHKQITYANILVHSSIYTYIAHIQNSARLRLTSTVNIILWQNLNTYIHYPFCYFKHVYFFNKFTNIILYILHTEEDDENVKITLLKIINFL